MVAYEFLISGKVQGVFYRASCLKKAEALGLKGEVKNTADGSVYVHCEGDEKIIPEFAEWCKRGPMGAVVKNFNMQEVEPKGYTQFKITYRD